MVMQKGATIKGASAQSDTEIIYVMSATGGLQSF